MNFNRAQRATGVRRHTKTAFGLGSVLVCSVIYASIGNSPQHAQSELVHEISRTVASCPELGRQAARVLDHQNGEVSDAKAKALLKQGQACQDHYAALDERVRYRLRLAALREILNLYASPQGEQVSPQHPKLQLDMSLSPLPQAHSG